MGLQSSFDLLIEVIANFKTEKVPTEGIVYLAAHVGRISADLSMIHPEYLYPLFEKASFVLSEDPELGLKLMGALGVSSLY